MATERGEYRVGRWLAQTSRPVGFAVVAATYLVAGVAAWGVAAAARGQHPLAVTLCAAIVIEAAADQQLRRFARDPAHRSQVADRGLWRHSRHPDYLGEIGFWWGMWLFGLAAAPAWWWTVAGPLAMVLLFTFVSVPMMDRRSLERRPAYAEHMRRVPALLPSPRSRHG